MKLQEAYAELKTDMLEEVNQVDTRITNPATDAKEYLQPIKKVIKKRQDRKVPQQATCTSALLTLCSLISRGTKVDSIPPIRKPNERSGRTLPLPSTSRIWHEQKRFVYVLLDRDGLLWNDDAALLAIPQASGSTILTSSRSTQSRMTSSKPASLLSSPQLTRSFRIFLPPRS